MSEADQLLAQQASQTANLMRAIGDNTQRAFDNQFRVQAAQMSTGLQVAGQIEQYRMNDAKLVELNQTMRIRDQEYQWEKANQAFAEKLRPLQFQAQQYDLQNKFRIQAEQRMSPFLTDIKGEFQQLIMERPELAADAQSLYATSIDGVLNSTMSNPNSDVATLLQSKKDEMRKWIEKSRMAPEGPSPKIGGLLGAGIDAANKMLGTTFDPLSAFKAKEKSVTLTTDQTSRAAAIYSTTFGGVTQDFLRKHDTLYKGSTESAFRIMMASGQLTSQEDYAKLTTEQQAAVADRIEKKQRGTVMKETLEEMQKEIDNYVDNNAKSGGAYSTLIDRLREQRNSMQRVYNKEILGVDITEETGPPRSAIIEENAARVYGSGASTDGVTSEVAARVAGFKDDELPDDAQTAIYNRVQKQLKPYWIVEFLGGTQNAETLKSLVESDSLNSDEVAKLIDKSSEVKLAALAKSDEFNRFVKMSGLAVTQSGASSNAAARGATLPSFIETNLGKAIREIGSSKSTPNQKKNALKVLKKELPTAIMRYTTQ